MNDIQEDIDYKFLFSEEEDFSEFAKIQLLTGEFSGVVYHYGKVSVQEDKENDQAFLNFEYDVVSDNGLSLSESHDFKEHIGNILVGIISKQMVQSDLDIEDAEIIEE